MFYKNSNLLNLGNNNWRKFNQINPKIKKIMKRIIKKNKTSVNN